MRRILFCVALAFTACSYYQDPTQIEANIVAPGNFKTGSGVITNVGVLPNANKGKAQPSVSGRAPDPNLYRITVRMDIGGIQSVDIDDNSFVAGQAVELTNDGRLVHVTGTSLNRAVR
jgi:hypothetical protein